MGIKDEEMWKRRLKATNNDCDLLVLSCSPNVSLSDWLKRSSNVLKFGTCIYLYSNGLVINSFGGFLWSLHSVRVLRALGRFSSGIKIRYLFIHSFTRTSNPLYSIIQSGIRSYQKVDKPVLWNH